MFPIPRAAHSGVGLATGPALPMESESAPSRPLPPGGLGTLGAYQLKPLGTSLTNC
jgi:hypothetical protein